MIMRKIWDKGVWKTSMENIKKIWDKCGWNTVKIKDKEK